MLEYCRSKEKELSEWWKQYIWRGREKGTKKLYFKRYMKWKSEADDQGFAQVQVHNSVSERESGHDVLETDLHLLTYECLIYWAVLVY